MSEKYLGQIMLAGFDFAPKFYARCDGSLLSIAQNQALFSLLGVQYGGNGTTNFALPDLRGRVPVGAGQSVDSSWQPPAYAAGAPGGVETVPLNSQQIPLHLHQANGTIAAGAVRNPTGSLFGTNTAQIYAPASGGSVPLSSQTLASAGNSQAHENMQPFLVVNYCIAMSGIYPSRS